MLQKNKLEYYDWKDIRTFLCEKMDIPFDSFSNYNGEINGGNYRNCWFVWLNISNHGYNYAEYVTDNFKALLIAENKMIFMYGNWVTALFEAIRELQKEVDSNNICIKYQKP